MPLFLRGSTGILVDASGRRLSNGSTARTWIVGVGDDPQAIVSLATAGDTIRFDTGTHTLSSLTNHAGLYVDKRLNILIPSGATLKLANNTQTWKDAAEVIAFNYPNPPNINDMTAQIAAGESVSRVMSFRVRISTSGTPDKFRWSVAYDGAAPALPSNSETNITGDWQNLGNNVQIKFNATTGHNIGGEWWVLTGGEATYLIRVGTGFQEAAIDGVRIYGGGVLDWNVANQNPSNVYAAETDAAIYAHGRVTNLVIKDLTLTNTGDRSIRINGEHSGTHQAYGAVTGGVSYDLDGATIQNITADGSVLCGHPAHRGMTENVTIFGCDITENSLPTIEPNFRCNYFEVTGNWIDEAASIGIHAYRGPSYGSIHDNYFYNHNPANKVVISSPSGWPVSIGVTTSNNFFATKP